ncbi:MAG: beta-galactosidase, partial [Bacteroidaceae bacterium]
TGVTFGMRSVSQGDNHVRLNGHDIHLRGTLECCVFPLTGYPATDVASWERILRTIKSYGMNHVRFHSWCPPEAAFTAADRLGMYLQAELPMWIKDVGKYPARRDFFERELYAVLEEYGNHPSFLLMCNGNENEGDFAVLEDLVKKGRAHDNRHLYSASTARTHTASDQFYTSHVTSKGGITVYEGVPSTDWDKRKESDIDCPVIAHESGQRCMYPNFDEMKKYTGVVEPRNFEVFKERLTRNGMLHQARDFFEATGAHTVLQYKEVNESLLRTPNSGGFQLLGLSDFPGQGSAYVGILDAFWESKGLVSPEKFRESCGPTVLLARLPKRTFTNNESLKAKLEIYHYGQFPIKNGKLTWQLIDSDSNTIKQGKVNIKNVECSTVDSIATLNIDLNNINKAKKLTLHATLDNSIHNQWDIWVYPTNAPTANKQQQNFTVATKIDQNLKQLLEEGKNVLLIPQQKVGRKTHFASHFWNPIMFNWNPMIVGTLIENHHPAFNNFPTDKYADWQWWDILNNAWAMEFNSLQQLTPIIQSIDTYEHNRKLGIAFECRVAKGNLFVLSLDTEKNISKRPATQQLLTSIKEYLNSEEFCPQTTLEFRELETLFAPKNTDETTNSNAIQQLLNQ